MDVEVFYFGNAHETQLANGTWAFSCQHGPRECLANTLITCGIHQCANQTEWMPWLYCMQWQDDPGNMGELCANETGLDWNKINDCAHGPLGNKLEHIVANATDSLQPPHQFTPWVLVDGVKTESRDNLFADVCAAYKGPKPAACANATRVDVEDLLPNSPKQ